MEFPKLDEVKNRLAGAALAGGEVTIQSSDLSYYMMWATMQENKSLNGHINDALKKEGGEAVATELAGTLTYMAYTAGDDALFEGRFGKVMVETIKAPEKTN